MITIKFDPPLYTCSKCKTYINGCTELNGYTACGNLILLLNQSDFLREVRSLDNITELTTSTSEVKVTATLALFRIKYPFFNFQVEESKC